MADTDMSKIVELSRQLEAMGCAVVIFTEEELRGARPDLVQDRLVELGWDVIDVLATESDQDRLTEEDWNWAIK
jgi:uroporphyrinogen-III synthase